MNIKDSYIHNGTAVLKDVKVENSVLKKILAGKDANDAYLGWETVCDLTGIKPKAAGTADKVGHKLTFSGGVTGTWDGSADKTVTIPTKSSWNYDDVYLKLTGNGTTNPLTGTIYIKDVNGIILNSKDKDLNIWEVYGNSGAWASQYGFNLQYLGTGLGNNNDLVLWAHNQAGTHVETYRVKQDGTFIFKAAPKVGTNIMYHAGNLTIKTLMGTTAIGDSDEPVYWNGSSFVKAGAYPTKASWNYDDRYLKLDGGKITGPVTFETSNDRKIYINNSDDETYWSLISFQQKGTEYGTLGTAGSTDLQWNGHNLYHAGNLTASVIGGLGTLSNNISGNAATATNANFFVGCNNTITVAGDANTYYPVMISTTTNKKSPNIITVWKDLGSKTASYPENHSDGSSSMLYRYDIRNCYWDGNGGYCTTLDARYMYARLVSETMMLYNGVGNFCIWLRGGGTEYNINTSWYISPSDINIYYSSTNVGSSTYPVTIAPRTDIGNEGVFNTITIPCNVKYAATANWATSAGSATYVLDVNGSSATTFAYSKSGLNYGDYTWLAGWNGYELRAINKSQFAQASHTHTKSQITDFPTSLPANGGYADAIASKSMLDSQEKIDNFITPNRFEYALFKTNDANNVDFASNDGMILSIPWNSTTYGAQLAFDDSISGTVKVRGKSNSWGSWYTLLHSGNYTSYTVQKDGTGASGTWGINITGNAKTATTSTYASNVGSSGTAGTNYVTAANVISMYNWYNSITATDDASNTAIDKWNEIVSFLTGITDTSTLSGILAGYAAAGHDHDGRYVKKAGDTMTGLLTTTSEYSHKGIKVGDTYINAIGSDLIFQNNGAIRFGGDSWDYSVWAGLKYVHSSKTIYLGLAGNSVFTANSDQSGGTLNLSGIYNISSTFYNIKVGSIIQHIPATSGWYTIAQVSGYFNYDLYITGGWWTGMPSTVRVNICNINGTTKITQFAGYIGSHCSQIRLGQVNTDVWDVQLYINGQTDTLGDQKCIFTGYGGLIVYNTNTVSSTSYSVTNTLAFGQISGISLTSDNYTSYLDGRYYTESEADNRYVNVTGDTMTGSITMSSGAYIIFNGSIGAGTGSYHAFSGDNLYLAANKSGQKIYLESTYQSAPYFRNQHGDYVILHSGNYNSYSPTLTGTGASGTWAISISGNAKTATNVAWSGITNKPTFTTWSETSSTASYSLSNAAWTNTITLPTTAGSYILNIVSGNSTLTGVFSIGASDNAKDEISLHLHGNGPRLYARTNGTTLQLSSNDTSATSRSVTIKYRRMI